MNENRKQEEMRDDTNRFQIHGEDVIEARAPLYFVARAAVGAVQLQVALLHACNEPAYRDQKRSTATLKKTQLRELTKSAAHGIEFWAVGR